MTTTRRQFLMAAAAVPAFGARTIETGPVRVVALPDKGIQPQIVMADGVLHLIYFDGDPKSGNVFYTRSHDFGQKFSPPIPVNNQPGTAIAVGSIRGAQIAAGGKKKVHVAWNAADGKAMFYAQLNDNGTAFAPQRNLMGQTFGLDGGGSITADHAGNVYVGWHGKIPGAKEGEAGRRVWLASSRDEGRTFEKERAVSNEANGACGCCALRMFADSRGEVYGLYRTAAQNVHRDIHLLHSGDKAASFSDKLVQRWEINACPMSSMDFIETSNGVVAAWETQTQVYYAPVARIDDSPISPPGDRPRRKYPVLARNKRGETLLAWVEGSAWQKGGLLGWQIFDAAGKPLAACSDRHEVPVWSFAAVLAKPDDTFTILV